MFDLIDILPLLGLLFILSMGLKDVGVYIYNKVGKRKEHLLFLVKHGTCIVPNQEFIKHVQCQYCPIGGKIKRLGVHNVCFNKENTRKLAALMYAKSYNKEDIIEYLI